MVVGGRLVDHKRRRISRLIGQVLYFGGDTVKIRESFLVLCAINDQKGKNGL